MQKTWGRMPWPEEALLHCLVGSQGETEQEIGAQKGSWGWRDKVKGAAMCILVLKAMKPDENKSGGDVVAEECDLKNGGLGDLNIQRLEAEQEPQGELRWRDWWQKENLGSKVSQNTVDCACLEGWPRKRALRMDH